MKTFLIRQYRNSKSKNENKKKLGLNPQTMSRLNELRQSCDHPQIVNRQRQLIGISGVGNGRLTLQTIIKKMLNNSMSRQNVEGDARHRYLEAISKKYGVDLDTNTANGSNNGNNNNKAKASSNHEDKTKKAQLLDEDDELSTCMICMDQPEVFVITKTCGHTACKVCIDRWLLEQCPYREKEDRHAKCPTCKQIFHASDLEEYSNTATIELKKNLVNPTTALQLQASDNGTKINAVLRIMFEALQKDPSSKFVIFSQYREMLDLTHSVLKANSLGVFESVRLQFSNKDLKATAQDDLNRFLLPYEKTQQWTKNSKEEKNIGSSSASSEHAGFQTLKHKLLTSDYANILLLSIRSGGFSGAAGLTLTVANHCFILDPVWNPSLEDQAIARISRIGQKKENNSIQIDC